jgi:hypothetical protein
MTSVKETLELLDGMGTAAALIKKIVKDGLSPALILRLKEIADAMPEFKEAVDGVDEIPAELKDLDEAEVVQIIGSIYAQSKKISS